jgi:hypothetical protein
LDVVDRIRFVKWIEGLVLPVGNCVPSDTDFS